MRNQVLIYSANMHEFDLIHKDLYFRPLTAADVEGIHKIWTNEHVRKYLFDDETISLEWASYEIEMSSRNFARHGYGLWAVFRKPETKMLGFTGYREFHDPPELQLLYGLLPTYTGRGLATIMAKAMIRYGFEKLAFDEIVACADVPNVASIRVLQKAGMRFRSRRAVDGWDLVWYHILRDDWIGSASAGKSLAAKSRED